MILLALVIQLPLLLIVQVRSYNQRRYDGAKVLEVKYDEPPWKYMEDRGYHVYPYDRGYINVVVPSDEVDEVTLWLKTRSVEFTVASENLGALIRAEDSPLETAKYVGCIYSNQAQEWIGPASVLYILHRLVENRRWMLEKSIDFYVVPVPNPDGYVYSYTQDRLWSKSRSMREGEKCLGVNLNRNYDINFGGIGSSSNPCAWNYAGPGPMSEPEVRALADFLLHDRRIKGFITFHGFGQKIRILNSFAHGAFPSNYKEEERVAMEMSETMKEMHGSVYKVSKGGNLNNDVSGTFEDWFKKNMEVNFTYLIQLRDTGKYGHLLPPEQGRLGSSVRVEKVYYII